MPKFLCEEMQEYIGMLYGLKKKDRIFTVTKSYLHHEMDRGADKIVEPLVKRLKFLIKTLMVRCFQAIDDYQRLNQKNASLYRSNERLKSQNRQLTDDNNRLREEIKDYKLL